MSRDVGVASNNSSSTLKNSRPLVKDTLWLFLKPYKLQGEWPEGETKGNHFLKSLLLLDLNKNAQLFTFTVQVFACSLHFPFIFLALFFPL